MEESYVPGCVCQFRQVWEADTVCLSTFLEDLPVFLSIIPGSFAYLQDKRTSDLTVVTGTGSTQGATLSGGCSESKMAAASGQDGVTALGDFHAWETCSSFLRCQTVTLCFPSRSTSMAVRTFSEPTRCMTGVFWHRKESSSLSPTIASAL
ncbi:uncharacterized protein LOC144928116 [Branchiostoma floridae x Branchiostoma belcheri]